MKAFCESYPLRNLIRQPTCNKNLSCTSCIDLMLTSYVEASKVLILLRQGSQTFVSCCPLREKSYQSYVINISRSLHGRIINNNFKWGSLFFNRNSYRGCLVYMFSLCFLGSTFLINLRWQFRVRKSFNTQVFAGFAVFILCLRLFRKCVNYLVLGYSFIETCQQVVKKCFCFSQWNSI